MQFSDKVKAMPLLLCALAIPARADRSWPVERISERLENQAFSAAGGDRLLVVDNVCGSIHIHSHPRDAVSVTITETIHARTERDAERAQRETELRVVRSPDTVRLVADGPFRRADGSIQWAERRFMVCYDLEIIAPARIDLDVRTINKGGIEVRGIEGDLIVHNVNGPVTLRDIVGGGELSTVNGDIGIAVRALPAQPWSIETVNGDVEARFPAGLRADLRFTTRNGEILSGFEARARTGEPPKARRDANGIFHIQRQRAVLARVGSGGPEIAIETLNGDITLRRTGGPANP